LKIIFENIKIKTEKQTCQREDKLFISSDRSVFIEDLLKVIYI